MSQGLLLLALTATTPEVALDNLRVQTEELRDATVESFETVCKKANVPPSMCKEVVINLYNESYKYGYMQATYDYLTSEPN